MNRWQDDAACADSGVDFFVANERYQRDAKKLCARCPVRRECLAEDMEYPAQDRWGIRAGETGTERGGPVEAPEYCFRGHKQSDDTVNYRWSRGIKVPWCVACDDYRDRRRAFYGELRAQYGAGRLPCGHRADSRDVVFCDPGYRCRRCKDIENPRRRA